MERIFAQVRDKDIRSLCFLQDACRLAKQVPPAERQALHERMVELKLFDLLGPFVRDLPPPAENSHSPPAHHVAVEIIALCAAHAAGDGRALLSALCKLLINDGDQGVQSQVFDVLK